MNKCKLILLVFSRISNTTLQIWRGVQLILQAMAASDDTINAEMEDEQ